MKPFLPLLCLSLAALSCRSVEVGDPLLVSPTRMVHSVFFDLRDDSPEACRAQVEACYDVLAKLPGVLSLNAGTRIEDLARDVNDQDFDVALHVVFEDRAAYDNYAQDPGHLALIEASRDNWVSVRVFDALAAR